MLNYNEIVPRKVILYDDQPYEVLSSHVFRKQMAKPQNQTKIKNLLTGKVIEITFHQTDKVEEADMGIREIKYLYVNRNEYWFCDSKNPSNRFKLSEDQVGDGIRFITSNSIVEARTFNDEIIGMRYPIKVELKVKEAAPAVKGNTAQGASKQVILETGVAVNVPLFINEGDMLRINTETGEYTERVEKA